mgnify:CR=1 FL=1
MSVKDYIQSITQNAPVKGIRYDEYEPQKYNSITVDDAHLEDIVVDFNHIDFYCIHSMSKEKGLLIAV